MNSKPSQTLLLALLGCSATAAAAAVPEPVVTPAPLVPRAVTTVGYMSTGTARGTTLWVPITLNGESLVVTTSGSIYRLCDPSLACEFFYCQGSYAIFPSSSVSCGGSSTCSFYVLASDINDPSPLTNYWCDSNTKTGGTIYRTTPGATVTPTSIRTTSAPTPGLTTSIPPVTSSSTSPTPSPAPPAPKSSTPIGAIVGGVIGGIAVIGAIIVGVIFLLRRKRNSPSTPVQAPAQYHQTQPMAQPPVQPGGAYYDQHQQGYPPEKTSAATQVNPYYNSVAGGPSSPVPQYGAPISEMPAANTTREVNELPTQRL